MTIRAKFKCINIASSMQSSAKRNDVGAYVKDDKGNAVYVETEMRTIKFTPVYANSDPDHENTKFWNASPSGIVVLGTINLEAWKEFVLGGEYYLDFTAATKA